eukprot:6097139-Amphidinium_carterae.1
MAPAGSENCNEVEDPPMRVNYVSECKMYMRQSHNNTNTQALWLPSALPKQVPIELMLSQTWHQAKGM